MEHEIKFLSQQRTEVQLLYIACRVTPHFVYVDVMYMQCTCTCDAVSYWHTGRVSLAKVNW